MEPLRPLVDLWTDAHCDDLYEELTRDNRRGLIDLVNQAVVFDGRKMRVRYAIDQYVKSLTSAIEGQDAGLLRLPVLTRADRCLRMNRMADRFMRLLVFFDLPVNTKKRRREYARFRKALIQDGFLMLQYSVYVRLAPQPRRRQKAHALCGG